MLKAVIVDLNGIFIQSPKLSKRIEKDFSIPVSEFLPKLKKIMDAVRQQNAGPAFSYWEPVLKELGLHFSEQKFWDYWFKSEKVSEDAVALARELRAKGIKVIILSNNFKERADYYGHYPWIYDAVDYVYFSFRTGFVKPDPKAWEFILKEHSLKPDECLYFDDQDKNLETARNLGIPAFLFRDIEDMKEKIEPYLNL